MMLHKTVSNQSSSPNKAVVVDRRPKTSGDSRSSFWKRRVHLDDVKRDSGLAPSFASSGKDSMADGSSDIKSTLQVPGQEARVPSIAVNDAVGAATVGPEHPPLHSAPSSSRASAKESDEAEDKYETPSTSPAVENFAPLSTSIETGGFEDPFGADHLTFSKRGSVLLDGQKAYFDGSKVGSVTSKKSPESSSKSPHLGLPRRSPSTAEKRLSQKVRSMYEGAAIVEDSEQGLGIADMIHKAKTLDNQRHAKSESTDDAKDTVADLPRIMSPTNGDLSINGRHLHARAAGARSSFIKMEPWEAAGGIEDYHDVSVADVDRYGFIRPNTAKSYGSSRGSTPALDNERNRRASNPREQADHASVRNGKLHKPPPSSTSAHRLSVTSHASRPTSKAGSHAPSALSFRSYRSQAGSSRQRKWAHEAPGMLSVQPGLSQSVKAANQPDDSTKHRTEQRRVEKWEKMAKQLNDTDKAPKCAVGGGQVYAFDVHSPKLIERVWKGIPDVWRAPAWHSFLTASSKATNRGGYVHDHELIERYFKHQEQDSVDDIQIDMGVPRTVGQHVMFRARYRGGQRLLFRVLRALALEHPETGYVQGMAPLAATLLCYFDEEQAFVSACRLWRDRGLAELFAPGFGGLMSALNVFETKWLAENQTVKKQLAELSIPATSYGTKWYLTLFNYALPFEAQLRVWDVFILLGGSPAHSAPDKSNADQDDGRFDILHAVAAAIIDALQDTLVGAEFENAMSALTGDIPIGNEDVLMKVTKREFDERQKRRKKGR